MNSYMHAGMSKATNAQCCAAGDKAHRWIFRVPGRRPPPAARMGAAAGAPAVLQQEGEAPGEGGQMFPRSIYHLHSNPSAPMLDLREFAKVWIYSLEELLLAPPFSRSASTEVAWRPALGLKM